MGLFNKLFRGAPRIGLSNEDRGAAQIADDVLSRSGHLSRVMEREGVVNESDVATKGRVDAARKLFEEWS